ncbi:non-reducing polyketide synthase pyr2 [Aspergillus fischeri NRRL 181]|uniref:Polyketide synthase, putative n=1 Tax=Neosartorya fischeri (strain ATCC 1020 / DSM 3700 / CBS 544.65 / FGSC A1164 / JCM 1740 / NRRL 181 / WB 181) TaxID=331117 RepID=A1DC25_NEOFI|nr:polyketide synthase, putative [Aspergillus fischeri NRRL 181]EAW20415.1 polyketide synthase, putative [Aspergillus fischeri NRRL 181]
MEETEPVAIIGTGCRFPGGASSPAKLWELLRDPREIARKIPANRFNIDAFYHPDGDHHGTTNVQESYFLDEDIRAFDAAFFNISPTEAAAMDPQQRLLLETVYESLDAAGLRMDALQGSMTGVFCGALRNDYSQIQAMDPQALPAYMVTGNSPSIMANRISYYFDWRGPSMTVDTGCSSSLLAVHLGVEALQNDDCSLAVAVGSNLILSPNAYIADSKTRMLSPTGRSRMWDSKADGYARGEGVASVVLKRLRDAIIDADPIECVIRASGANSDGRTMGITMPNARAQQSLILKTYARAGLSPQDRPADRCQYFEAHGTGTQAGDPQEAAAIHASFFGPESVADPLNRLYVGSIKTVVGHTEATAGLAGLIKASLSLQHGMIVPNLLMQQLNPKIEAFAAQLCIPTECVPWPALPEGCPRRASVNSFGFGGANVHVILESYTSRQINPSHNLPSSLPFVFSAASERTLTSVLESYATFLREHAAVSLLSLAVSVWTRRSVHRHRLTLIARSVEELQDHIDTELSRRATGKPSSIVSRSSSRPRRVLGIFTGQGVQWPQMGLDLIEASPQIRQWMADLQEALDQLPLEFRPEFSLLRELSRPASSSRVHEGLLSLPLRTALQIMQVNILRAVGIEFSMVVGHSSGEIVAAYAAGVLTASDAIRIAYLRGRAIDESRDSTGRMMAVNLTWQQAQAVCGVEPYSGRISVAAANSPSSVTLSGDAEGLRDLEWLLKSLGFTPRMLHVDTAYHSPYMKPCADPYRRAMQACPVAVAPSVARWYSSVYPGEVMTGHDQNQRTGEYWVENMLRPVQFAQALEAAVREAGAPEVIIEVGPHPTLRGPVLQTLSKVHSAHSTIPYLALAERGKPGPDCWAMALGLAWAHLGPSVVRLDGYVSLFDPGQSHLPVESLPPYPFDRSQTYWAQSRISLNYNHCVTPPNALLGVLSPETGPGEFRWRNYLRPEELPWLADRHVGSRSVFPETGYISMALEAGRIIVETKGLRLLSIKDLTVHTPLPIQNDPIGTEVLVTVDGIFSHDGIISALFRCEAAVSSEFVECATAKMIMHPGDPDRALLPTQGQLAPALAAVNINGFYNSLRCVDYHCTGPFAGLTGLHRRRDLATGTVHVPSRDPDGPIILHPASLELAVQAMIAALGAPDEGLLTGALLSKTVDNIWVNPALCVPGKMTVVSYLTDVDGDHIRGDIDIFTMDGQKAVQLEGVCLVCQPSGNAPTDMQVLSQTEWGPLEPSLKRASHSLPADVLELYSLRDELALLYIKQASDGLTDSERSGLDCDGTRLLAQMNQCIANAREGLQLAGSSERLDGSIEAFTAGVGPSIDDSGLRAIAAVGQQLPHVLRESGHQRVAWPHVDEANEYLKQDVQVSHLVNNLISVVSQTCFRFPQMDILQIGTLGGSVHSVLRKMGRSFRSFTYAAPSQPTDAADLERPGEVLHKTFDVNRNPLEQGYRDHAYDMALFTTATFPREVAVANIRRLLKPRGFLVLLVRSNPDITYLNLLFGPPARCIETCSGEQVITREHWIELLSTNGFWVESLDAPPEIASHQGFSLLLCRAPGDYKNPSSRGDLLLLGGDARNADCVISELAEMVQGEFDQVLRSPSLDLMEVTDVSGLTVLILVDDRDLTDASLSGLRRLITTSKRTLWVTCEKTDQPNGGLMRGLLRSIMASERQSCQLQLLHITDPAGVSAEVLATALERLVQASAAQECPDSCGLDSIEPEVEFDGSMFRIPRQYHNHSTGLRHLARRQTVTDCVDFGQGVVQVLPPATDATRERFRLLSVAQPPLTSDDGSTIHLRVRYSSLAAVRVAGAMFLRLVIGREVSSNNRMIALSSHIASQVIVPESWAWSLPDTVSEAQEQSFLHATAAALLAGYLFDQIPPFGTLVVHEADRVFQSIVHQIPTWRNVKVIFSTSTSNPDKDGLMLSLHEHSTARQLSQILPSDVSAVAVLNRRGQGIYDRMLSLLPDNATRIQIDDLYRASAFTMTTNGRVSLLVAKAFITACLVAYTSCEAISLTSVDLVLTANVAEYPTTHCHQGIIDWDPSIRVLAQIPTASSQVQLSQKKTYILVGLASELARMACLWLAAHGARWILLASSKPEPDAWWLEEVSSRGTRIAFSTMNLIDGVSVTSLHQSIAHPFPPAVGGVLIEPGPLPDCSLSQLTAGVLQSQLNPVLKELQLLDELHETPTLDFWVLIGSIAGTLGHADQAMTAAMSERMATLVRQRRSWGRPASLVHLGEISGIDIPSAGPRPWWGPAAVTQQDIDEVLSEAVLCGGPNSTRSAEFIVGLRHQSLQTGRMACPVPKLWPFYSYTATASQDQMLPLPEPQSAKDLVAAATSREEKAEAIAACLMEKIRTRLNLVADAPLSSDTLIPELGVDSLVAVELRRWFAKELAVDIPIVLILSGASVGELAYSAASKLCNDNSGLRNSISLV